MDALLNKIADELLATGSWLEGDPFHAGTKRVVKHAVDANFYVFFERLVTNSPNSNIKLNEVKVTISSGFDLGTHLPTGTVETTSIPAEAWQRGNSGSTFYLDSTVGNGNKTGQYWLWVDSATVSLLVTWTPSSLYDYTSFFHLERNSLKEYADGFTNFFIVAFTNEDRSIAYSGVVGMRVFEQFSSGSNNSLSRKEYVRPFNLSTDVYPDGIATFFDCYKSNGNAKVYFQFPYYSNNLDPIRRVPIASTTRWFRLGVGLGIADGDLIDWVNGAELWKFLAKTLQSPDSTIYLPIAIRYA